MGELTAAIVHEVNQPIAGVVANAEAAKRWLVAEPADLEEAKQALESIVEDGKRTSEIVNRIRALGAVSGGSDSDAAGDPQPVLECCRGNGRGWRTSGATHQHETTNP
jgi:signal transduction histidine kinase